MVNSIWKIGRFRAELKRATNEPYDMDFIADVERFWKNGTIPGELINECRTFLSCKITEVIAGGLKHCNIQGVVINPFTDLEDIVAHCARSGELSNEFLWCAFKDIEQAERVPFIKTVIDDVDHLVAEYL